MSYGYSSGLQAAVFQHLTSDSNLNELIGGDVFDGPLEGAPVLNGSEHVTLGEETVRPNNSKTSQGAILDFSVSVHSARDGFKTAKRIAGVICDRLVDADLTLDRGVLVALRFLRAKAERGPAPVKRRIILRFRAVVDEQ